MIRNGVGKIWVVTLVALAAGALLAVWLSPDSPLRPELASPGAAAGLGEQSGVGPEGLAGGAAEVQREAVMEDVAGDWGLRFHRDYSVVEGGIRQIFASEEVVGELSVFPIAGPDLEADLEVFAVSVNGERDFEVATKGRRTFFGALEDGTLLLTFDLDDFYLADNVRVADTVPEADVPIQLELEGNEWRGSYETSWEFDAGGYPVTTDIRLSLRKETD